MNGVTEDLTAAELEIQEFRVSRQNRRLSIVYLVGGISVIVTLLVARGYIRPDTPIDGGTYIFLSLIFVGLPFGYLVVTFSWRLRLTKQGISRRRWFVWDHWPWEAFENGDIHRVDGSFSFEWRSQPCWRRTLSFVAIEASDRKLIRELCDRFWKAPPIGEIPEHIDVELAGWSSQMHMDENGIRVKRRKIEKVYTWEEVEEIRIKRISATRIDFHGLDIVLTDQTITLKHRHHEQGPDWLGPESRIVAAFLRQHVFPGRIVIAHLTGPAKTRADVDARVELLRTKLKDANLIFRSFPIVAAALLLICVSRSVFDGRWGGNLTVGGLIGLVFLTFCLGAWQTRKAITAEKARLESLPVDE